MTKYLSVADKKGAEGREHIGAGLTRIARASGHLNAFGKMAENGRDCSEVLIRLSAVKAGIVNLGKLILEDHQEHCIPETAKEGEEEKRRSKAAIDRLL